METKSKNISLKAILIIMTIGIWAIVLQNAGIIPTKQNVYVKGGYIDADVNGSVDVSGSVSVDNEIDVNIKSLGGYALYGGKLKVEIDNTVDVRCENCK